ncbi:hypothetical protein [Kitasatospora sp. NPDC050463]|uniref:hypothetical protein n=1 Tax=Kitasatospora sp. NPDC050463 TaxID=3155786 RepID=UPI0033F50956
MITAAKPFTRLENDTAAVYVWLRANAGREVTYKEIAKGTGIPVGGRLQRAVRQLRAAAEHLGGHRLERFRPSRDPRLKRASVTRFNLSGKGDEYSSDDVVLASRLAVTAMEDLRRSARYEAANLFSNGSPEMHAQMADAVEGCIQTVSGVTGLNVSFRQIKLENLALSERVAQLEARLEHVGTSEDGLQAAG